MPQGPAAEKKGIVEPSPATVTLPKVPRGRFVDKSGSAKPPRLTAGCYGSIVKRTGEALSKVPNFSDPAVASPKAAALFLTKTLPELRKLLADEESLRKTVRLAKGPSEDRTTIVERGKALKQFSNTLSLAALAGCQILSGELQKQLDALPTVARLIRAMPADAIAVVTTHLPPVNAIFTEYSTIVSSVTLQNVTDGERKQLAGIKKGIEAKSEHLSLLGGRVTELSRVAKPSAVPAPIEPLLERYEERDITLSLIECRKRYWLASFKLPIVRDSAVSDLRWLVEVRPADPWQTVFKTPSKVITRDTIFATAALHVATIDGIIDRSKAESATGTILRRDSEKIAQLLAEIPVLPDTVRGRVADVKARLSRLDELRKELEPSLASPEKLSGFAQRAFNEFHDLSHSFGADLEAMSQDIAEVLMVEREYLRLREYLAGSNTRLVYSIAKNYLNKGLDIEELAQEGQIGLIKAIEKFDPGLGWKLATYATWWIEQAIERALVDQGRTVRVPAHQATALAKLRSASDDLYPLLFRDPLPDELAAHLEWEVKDVTALMPWLKTTLSLQGVGISEADGGREFGDTFADPKAPDETKTTREGFMRAAVTAVLDTLDEREAEVLRLRNGMVDGTCYTLEQIAGFYGISKERIRQIETAGKKKLRHPSRAAILRPYAELPEDDEDADS